MKLEFSRHTFDKKYAMVKFHENPSCRGRVVPCGRTDMTKLIVSSFAILRTRQKKIEINQFDK
jgi:hypothetical protein